MSESNNFDYVSDYMREHPPEPDRVEVISIAERATRAGHGRKLNALQRERNRARITELRFQNVSFREIAEELGVSVGYIYSEYKEVEKSWRAIARTSMDDLKARELAKLDAIEAEAWKAWQRSCDAATKQREEYEYQSDGNRRRKKGTLFRDDSIGNPKFLDVIAKCIDRRCKLLGLDPDVGSSIPDTPDALNPLSARIARYAGVLGVVAVGIPDALALDNSAGESVDTARSAPEASTIFDTHGSVR